MTDFIEPMAGVERVETQYGSRIEPDYNDRWGEATRISWLLAVIKIDHGLEARVYDSESKIKRFGLWIDVKPRQYGISAPGISCGAGAFDNLWLSLNMMGNGYSIAKRELES